VRGADQKLRAVVFGYACHNTSLGNYQINGDWAGFAMEALEKENAGAVALFVQGAGADSNPLPRRTVELTMRHSETMAAAVREVLGSRMKPVSGPLRAAYDLVELPFQAAPSRAELQARLAGKNPAKQRNARWLLAMLDRGEKIRTSYPDPVQVWEFEGGPLLLALGGELAVDYALRFKAKYGWATTWVAGYSNDVFGYVPSVRVLKEGGYEGGDALYYRPYPGPFAPAVEELIAGKVDELVERVGRL
jgi:neutral ceramidase